MFILFASDQNYSPDEQYTAKTGRFEECDGAWVRGQIDYGCRKEWIFFWDFLRFPYLAEKRLKIHSIIEEVWTVLHHQLKHCAYTKPPKFMCNHCNWDSSSPNPPPRDTGTLYYDVKK